MSTTKAVDGRVHGDADGASWQGYQMTARAIMVLGTSSHVGKSLTTAALCRIFARAGYRVAPFKAQNMSLNSAATPEGHEIGRAQALQAEAAGIAPSVLMNPVLIKPTCDTSSQIIVRGRVWGNLSASNYHLHRAITLLPIVEECYRKLADTYDIIVIEGAGSPAEINLKDNDIVNMRIAKMANAPCLLVGDIDRGGVFASLLGTCELLDEDERSYIRGFVINKFRGDQSLLMPGVRMMEQRLDKPCLGVVPYLESLLLDEEDSVDFGRRADSAWTVPQSTAGRIQIAVLAFPSISNFTDFDPLLNEPSVSLRFVRDPAELASAGVVILPGSKQTVSDLRWMQEQGFEESLRTHSQNGGVVIGICGGLQMLGMEILDPHGVESEGDAHGLGLLSIRTTLTKEKVTVPARGWTEGDSVFAGSAEPAEVIGYEIHMGQTKYLADALPFASLTRMNEGNRPFHDGCVSPNGRVFGTYLHGLFDHDPFRHAFLKSFHEKQHLPEPAVLASWSEHREQQLEKLADAFADALNLDAIFALLHLDSSSAQPLTGDA